jgi:hypothetical protein
VSEPETPRAPEDQEPPVSVDAPSSMSVGLEHPVLRATIPLAVVAVIALLSGRVVAPALKGVAVGTGNLVQGVGLLGAVSSQVFAFAGSMTAIVTIMAASRSRLPASVRFSALLLGGFAVLPTIWALQAPVPELSAALVAGSAALLALVASSAAVTSPFARAPALVVALIASGGVFRLAAIGLVYAAAVPRFAGVATAVPAIAVVSFVCDGIAVAVALAWVAARNRKLTSPWTTLALLVALVATRQALAGQAADARAVDLFCWRAAAYLQTLPLAPMPAALRIFVAFLAPLTAVAALLSRDCVRPLAAAIALALAARGALEMPPCALMLIVAALAAALTASDRRALWASLPRTRT